MKLNAAPQHHALLLHFLGLAFEWEKQVQGRNARLLGQFQSRLYQPRPVFGSTGQQARPGGGCKGYRTYQLGIVAQPVALVGICPGPVENKFAIGVGFKIQRHAADQLLAFPQGDELCQPAGFRGGTSGFL